MESLFNNKPLLYSLAFSCTAITALASGVVPDIADQFEIVPLPTEVRPVRFCFLLFSLKKTVLNH